MKDMHTAYMVSGLRDDQPIVLKISPDEATLSQEAAALKYFEGAGIAKLHDSVAGALLLEQISPGESLASHFPKQDTDATKIFCDVITLLHQAYAPRTHTIKLGFPHIRDWLKALDEAQECINLYYLKKARKIRDYLLETSAAPILLHGDLHHFNILKHHEHWIAIDPKGVMGEPCYDVAAFIRNPISTLFDVPDIGLLLNRRIDQCAALLGFDRHRILLWCFVQTVLCWVWALEDFVDPKNYIRLIKIFDRMLGSNPY